MKHKSNVFVDTVHPQSVLGSYFGNNFITISGYFDIDTCISSMINYDRLHFVIG